ncbi:type VII secretion protein EssB [Macrococcus armenti]|uniref:type VII secretion protein EssB n=1 Tax=Macrococcus armenti TaxID=2875764 RepID=UPI001CCFF35C|nr:type VII secretion protein EssB [Macrococcus armenti]UBH08107.1 type VII secretion protein EssB [Macrococcus armenti]UBH10336.1 type VII secretion protein EssB [Macrococcus armenti]
MKKRMTQSNEQQIETVAPMTSEILKSDAINASPIDLSLLVKPHQNLMDASLETLPDHYEVTYSLLPGDIPFNDIHTFERKDKLRYLLNIRSLYQLLDTRYTFLLQPDNIYFSKDGIPKLKVRGIQNKIPPTKLTETDFVKYYKALIMHVFDNKLQFEELMEGVQPDVKLSPFMEQINEANDISQIETLLETNFIEEKAFFNKNYQYYEKKKFNFFKYGMITAAILFAVAAGFLSFNFFHTDKIKQSIITAYQQYENKNYSSVLDTYKSVNEKNLTNNELYIYADSYLNVNEQGLDDDQINQIKNMVSVNAREDILKYWYKMGHSKYEEALNTAEIIGSNDMQKLALINLINQIKGEDLDSDKREEKIKPFQEKLDQIISKEKEIKDEEQRKKEEQAKAEEEAQKNKETAKEKAQETKKSDDKSK